MNKYLSCHPKKVSSCSLEWKLDLHTGFSDNARNAPWNVHQTSNLNSGTYNIVHSLYKFKPWTPPQKMARCWCCDFLWFARLPGWNCVEPTPPRFPSPPVLGWWLAHQPIWKIWSSKWVHLPQIFGEKMKKYLSCHHLVFFAWFIGFCWLPLLWKIHVRAEHEKMQRMYTRNLPNFYLQVLLLHYNPTSSEQKTNWQIIIGWWFEIESPQISVPWLSGLPAVLEGWKSYRVRGPQWQWDCRYFWSSSPFFGGILLKGCINLYVIWVDDHPRTIPY